MQEIKICNNCKYARFVEDSCYGDYLECTDDHRAIDIDNLLNDCSYHVLKDGAKKLYEEK